LKSNFKKGCEAFLENVSSMTKKIALLGQPSVVLADGAPLAAYQTLCLSGGTNDEQSKCCNQLKSDISDFFAVVASTSA
jgi:hypothetical protein